MDAEKTTTDADAAGEQNPRKTRRWDVAKWKNQRRLKFGLYQPRSHKSMAHADRMANKFREQLEADVIERHGEINLALAAQCQTAAMAVRYTMLASVLLRDEWETMDAPSRLAVAREALRGCTERDKVLTALGLDKPVSPILNGGLAPQLWSDEPSENQ